MIITLAIPITVSDESGLRAALVSHFTPIYIAPNSQINLSSKRLDIPDGTEIDSDGTANIFIGSNFTPENLASKDGNDGIRLLGKVTLSGLNFINKNSGSKPNWCIQGNWGPPNAVNDGLKIDNCNFDLANGQPILIWPSNAISITNSTFKSISLENTALWIAGMSNSNFSGDHVYWRTGYMSFATWSNSSIISNDFHLDGNPLYRHKNRPQTGGVGLTYSRDIIFSRNYIAQEGGIGTGDNDGEMLGSEFGNLQEWQGSGTIVKVAGNTLTTTAQWKDDPWYEPSTTVTQRRVCYLLSGRGVGQWRWANPTSDDGTITIDRAFDPVPLKGAIVSLSSLPAYNLSIVDNVIVGGTRGIQMYGGALSCKIIGNSIYDGGGVVLFSSSSKSSKTPNSGNEFWPIWDTVVQNNLIVSRDGRPASLSAYVTDVTNTQLPMGFKSVDLTGNIFVGTGASTPNDPLSQKDGISVSNVNETGAKPLASKIASLKIK